MKIIRRRDIEKAAVDACVTIRHTIEHDEGFFLTFDSPQEKIAFLISFFRAFDTLGVALEVAKSVNITSDDINFVGYRLEG